MRNEYAGIAPYRRWAFYGRVCRSRLYVIWEKLSRIETLRYIAAPYASFMLEEEADMIWREGETAHLHLKLFGFLSLGTHTYSIYRCG